MDKLIEEYLIAVNADRSSTDGQKQLIADHLRHFVKLIELRQEPPNAAEEK